MRPALYTHVLWLMLLVCCASTPTIKTWIIGPQGLIEDETHEALTFLQAQGYRCYSESDDEFWRDQLSTAEACCNGKSL